MTRATDLSTYEEDFFAWTQDQAAALRRLPRAAISDAVDVEHVAEEIEDLGKRDLREVASYLARLFEHMMKIATFPASPDVAHWHAEARLFSDGAVAAFSPSMMRALDIASIWTKARRRQIAYCKELGVGLRAPVDCPFVLTEMLNEDIDIDAALRKLTASSAG